MSARAGSNAITRKPNPGGSRNAIVDAAERLFLERGFGSVSMDELAVEAGVARRTLYNQLASKEVDHREKLRSCPALMCFARSRYRRAEGHELTRINDLSRADSN